ncbi:MAG: hypothetical protein KatS3mg009_0250 [Acidimicrobiia bacterium]|nr:MAG: hypothetical protein KatS3mg009_0250 [Acidimicrobiia bacterium]
MSVIVVGLNHRTVPVELLERMTVPQHLLPKVLHDLAGREHLLEVAVLSTCNRTEIYARGTRFHAAVGDVRDFLAAYSGATPDDFDEHLYTYFDDAAVGHLFAVASGLDSMIVGEGEILGQVRQAWEAAEREGSARQHLHRLFRHAVETGKRVRTETGIGRHPVSVPSAAVTVAAEHVGPLDHAKALVIGAGQMGAGLASTLRSARRRGAVGREPHAAAGAGARGARRRGGRSRSPRSPTRSSRSTSRSPRRRRARCWSSAPRSRW